MAIYSEFSHKKWWFSIVMLVYQRVSKFLPCSCFGYPVVGRCLGIRTGGATASRSHERGWETQPRGVAPSLASQHTSSRSMGYPWVPLNDLKFGWFPKIGVPQNHSFQYTNSLMTWMIWWYQLFRKPPFRKLNWGWTIWQWDYPLITFNMARWEIRELNGACSGV